MVRVDKGIINFKKAVFSCPRIVQEVGVLGEGKKKKEQQMCLGGDGFLRRYASHRGITGQGRGIVIIGRDPDQGIGGNWN